MTQTQAGWLVFLGAFGMMLGMVGVDIVGLKDWHEMGTPVFVGTFIGHAAAVIAAFVGGKIQPTDARLGGQRASDPPKG